MIINNDIVVIADTQVDSDSPLDHLRALSKYIWEHKPKHIVHIGDHWDFPSLSSYKADTERVGDDTQADYDGGFKAFDVIMEETVKGNRKGKKKAYKPNKVFIMGNHEDRLNRLITEQPRFKNTFPLKKDIEKRGWTVYDFLVPCFIDDICFIHFMPNPMSGRPVGGSVENKLNKFPHSFVHGHQQQFQFGRRQNMQGTPHFGVCAGSFYMHDEDYRGANNTEIRGFAHLKSYVNRYDQADHDVEFVSLERLLAQY
jgi:hypothetical protein